MPNKVVETPYPLIDADPHAGRVIRYMRPSDYAVWAGATGAFPTALYLWDKWDPSNLKIRTQLRLGGLLGFVGGFLLAYQRSSCELSVISSCCTRNLNGRQPSTVLGLVREQTRRGERSCGVV
ncbi:NADH-ubiquinone oxidoreductase complex I, 21 kDa subunit-domain-containing protein [Fomes fomentarius]|nr:NADH-ubiquinone oxidoreductase complex I, 21 kDa subunit-domain-containing protein [Fomes fomentarius]